MAIKLKALIGVTLLSMSLAACTSFQSDVVPPKGLFVTSFKAPLSVKADNITVGNPIRKKHYVTSFFWIPLTSLTVAITDMQQAKVNGEYADYDYTSILFGLYKSVSVTTYK